MADYIHTHRITTSAFPPRRPADIDEHLYMVLAWCKAGKVPHRPAAQTHATNPTTSETASAATSGSSFSSSCRAPGYLHTNTSIQPVARQDAREESESYGNPGGRRSEETSESRQRARGCLRRSVPWWYSTPRTCSTPACTDLRPDSSTGAGETS